MIPSASQTTVDQIGPIALNGTILAGTLMVKTEEEWDALRGPDGPWILGNILREVGIPQADQGVKSKA